MRGRESEREGEGGRGREREGRGGKGGKGCEAKGKRHFLSNPSMSAFSCQSALPCPRI